LLPVSTMSAEKGLVGEPVGAPITNMTAAYSRSANISVINRRLTPFGRQS
jgi:hypothetical protein